MLRELRAAGGRLRLRAGRRHRRRRGADVHVDGGGGRARRAARALRARALDHPRRARPGAEGAAPRGARAAPEAAPRRQGDRLLERARARCAGRGARAGSSAPTGSTAARGVGEFLLGPLSDEDGRLRRSYRDGRTSGAGVPRRLRERGARPARAPRRDRRAALARRRRTGWPGVAVELFLDDEHGGFFLAPADGERARGADEAARRPPAPVRQLDARARPAPARSALRATTSSSATRVGVLRLLRPALERAPAGLRLGPRRARPVALRRRASSRSSDPSTRRWPGPRSRRSSRAPSSRSGPRRASRCSTGKTLVDGQARRLRLRALRLPGAGHRSGRALIRTAGPNFPPGPLSQFCERSSVAPKRHDFRGPFCVRHKGVLCVGSFSLGWR